eukprot:15340136-Ditylum_brightwellii.AAC.1
MGQHIITYCPKEDQLAVIIQSCHFFPTMDNRQIALVPREFLLHNQVQQDEVQDKGWISDLLSKRTCTGMKIHDVGARLEKVVEEHNDKLKLSKEAVVHINKFI